MSDDLAAVGAGTRSTPPGRSGIRSPSITVRTTRSAANPSSNSQNRSRNPALSRSESPSCHVPDANSHANSRYERDTWPGASAVMSK